MRVQVPALMCGTIGRPLVKAHRVRALGGEQPIVAPHDVLQTASARPSRLTLVELIQPP